MNVTSRKVAAVTVAIVAVLATVSGCSSSGGDDSASENVTDSSVSDSAGGQTDDEPLEQEAVSSEFGLGDTVTDGALEFTVLGLMCSFDAAGLDVSTEGQYCRLMMNVTNAGDEPQLFDASLQKGLTNTGTTVDADASATASAAERPSLQETVDPGRGFDTVIVFVIPTDGTLAGVELRESASSPGVTVAL